MTVGDDGLPRVTVGDDGLPGVPGRHHGRGSAANAGKLHTERDGTENRGKGGAAGDKGSAVSGHENSNQADAVVRSCPDPVESEHRLLHGA